MQVNSSTLYDIGSNYSVKLNEKEILVYEEETLKNPKSEEKKLEKAREKEEAKKSVATDELSPDEKRLVNDLQARDAEVKAHEAAHQSGGASTGGASYTYQQGPDGKMYAIGGEVSVSVGGGSTPDEIISNARAVIASAMAPGDPSAQDMAVASSARVMMMKAEQQKAQALQEEINGKETYQNASTQDNDKKDQNNIKVDIAA
ncbi:putative metalloprotease CJM1_0395 family protein [Sulfurimonas sp.]|nr:putative metalloprotease CJM1_0395 family protein [Sulfurimonas sp.]